jgi:hypothetical protein
MPVDAFYRDFAAAEFGAAAGPRLGEILARLDGHLPQITGWMDGPGGILHHEEDWNTLAPQFAFVDEFAAARPLVRGAASQDRFDYWLAQFRFYRELARIGCTAGGLDRAMRSVAAEADPARRQALARDLALPLRLTLARQWTELLQLAIEGATTSGELGIIANLEQHNRTHLRLLNGHDAELERFLGGKLPAAAQPADRYAGPPRIIVPTVRPAALTGESVTLRVILLGGDRPTDAAIFWRPLGRETFARIPLQHVARRVFRGTLPAIDAAAGVIEYYVEANFGESAPRRWPASAPALNQTVVLEDG